MHTALSHRLLRLCGAFALLSALLLGVTSCTAPVASKEHKKVPGLSFSVEDNAQDVPVREHITVMATRGTLTNVILMNEETEKEVEGIHDHNQWTLNTPLAYNQSYRVTAYAQLNGETVTEERTFHTETPDNLTMPYVYPTDGMTVGVAQPVAVKFDEVISDRRAAQRCIHITTSSHTKGAFYWVSNTEVRWRGEHFWKPGTTITVKVECYGHNLGEGLYGQEDITSTFTIGDRVEGFADDKTKQLIIKKNGTVIKTMPISMGSAQHPTPNGIYYVGDQHKEIIMDSRTYGLPLDRGGYKTPVKWATRMSYSGIFIHGAPWSVAQQGSSNVSHGCLNVSDANGEWVYENLKPGDPVTVSNTIGGQLSGIDGLGDWNIPWEEWKAGNASSLY